MAEKENISNSMYGFSGELEVANMTGTHTLYFYAIDEGGLQVNPLLGHKTIVIEEPEAEKEYVHKYTETVIKEATCTEQGNRQYNCSICGEKRVEACACGEFVVETVLNLHEHPFAASEEDPSGDQILVEKEPETKADQTKAVPKENRTCKLGQFYYKVTKLTANENGGTVELKEPVVKTMTTANIPGEPYAYFLLGQIFAKIF